MKRNIFWATGILIILFTAGGCYRSSASKAEGKINVVSVIFPSYDFVRVIAGDRVNLIMLLKPGAESHSYEPSPQDMITIKNSDLFIYPGGQSYNWVDRILASMGDPKGNTGGRPKVLKMLDMVNSVEEETVEGMENDDETTGAEAGPSYDEHVWTAPKNAKAIVASITDALCDLDPADADLFRKNAADYALRLDELDAAFRSIVENAKRKTIVFGDRFPFRYFTDAYGLSYFAAFPGCSTETEASAATVAFLINKVKSEHIPVVFHIELSDERMADTICEATGAKKLLLHSCHNVSRKDFENGVSYLDIQKINADHLKEALW